MSLSMFLMDHHPVEVDILYRQEVLQCLCRNDLRGPQNLPIEAKGLSTAAAKTYREDHLFSSTWGFPQSKIEDCLNISRFIAGTPPFILVMSTG